MPDCSAAKLIDENSKGQRTVPEKNCRAAIVWHVSFVPPWVSAHDDAPIVDHFEFKHPLVRIRPFVPDAFYFCAIVKLDDQGALNGRGPDL